MTFTLIRLVPIEAKLEVIKDISPFTIPTRMITAATPMMIPSIVRNERILFAQMLLRARLNEFSIVLRCSVINYFAVRDSDDPFGFKCDGIVMGYHDYRVSVFVDFLKEAQHLL